MPTRLQWWRKSSRLECWIGALCLAAAFLAPAAELVAQTAESPSETSTLTVQSRWKLLFIGLGLEEGDSLECFARRSAAAIEHELSGLHVEVILSSNFAPEQELDAYFTEGDYEGDRRLVAEAVARAIGEVDHPEQLDLAMVFSPHMRTAFGYSHLSTGVEVGGRELPGSYVLMEPSLHLDRVIEERVKDPILRQLAGEAREVIRFLMQRRMFRDRIIIATAVHEFGHFLAPGDPDLKDGYQEEWLGHGTSGDPEDRHHPRCVMVKQFETRSIVEKALLTGFDGTCFCELCKERLGIPLTLPEDRWARRLRRFFDKLKQNRDR